MRFDYGSTEDKTGAGGRERGSGGRLDCDGIGSWSRAPSHAHGKDDFLRLLNKDSSLRPPEFVSAAMGSFLLLLLCEKFN